MGITGGSGGQGFGGGKGGGKGGFGGGKGSFGGGGGGGDGRSVYVSGFDFGADESTLRAHFSSVGTIDQLFFQGQGAAVVKYVDGAAAERACAQLDRTTMSGHSRYASVRMDGERKGKGKGKRYE